ncbi:MAG: SOS response-associated peptidase [Saprospiraceae bacterium]|nr:SOS response-associated peptidase [Saprospiraceae bacterium]
MCGRSSLTKTEKEIEQRFHATFYSEELERYNPLPNYNVAPTQYHPVITDEDPEHLHLYKWGLIPFWSKDAKSGYKMINAKLETLEEKPTFRNLVKTRRCLVPMDGFYEWMHKEGHKIPYRICTKDREIFAAAGLWEIWKDTSGNEIRTFTIITCPANDAIQPLHDRMPAILSRDHEKLWISRDISGHEALQLLIPYPSDLMHIYRVSEKVNNVRINEPELIQEIE